MTPNLSRSDVRKFVIDQVASLNGSKTDFVSDQQVIGQEIAVRITACAASRFEIGITGPHQTTTVVELIDHIMSGH